jgi:methylmalonyl-CoA mutase
LDSLSRGAESLASALPTNYWRNKTIGKLPLESVAIYFNLNFISIDFVKNWCHSFAKKKAIPFYNLDPIGQLAKDGNWFTTKDKKQFRYA